VGCPTHVAVGTDLFEVMISGLYGAGTYTYKGRTELVAAIIKLVGAAIGAQMIMWLERIGKVDLYVRWLYVGLLAFIAWMVFHDLNKRKQKERAAIKAGKEVDKLATGIEWSKTINKIKIPPVMHFKEGGFTCSAWLPILVSFITGWLAGILGIGGGLIRMPSLIYFVGCPTHVAVGTDLFEVMISGLYGAGTYTYKGRTELVAAIIMLVGAAVGAQIGTVATKYIKGYGIRIAFGIAVIGCMISIIMKLIPRYYPPLYKTMDVTSTVLILGLVSALSLYIFVRMLAGARRELAMKKGRA
jgi:hypothetical protein